MCKPMKLKNVRNGSLCRHTGTKSVRGTVFETYPVDKGVVFRKTCNSYQQVVGDGADRVIFGVNDIVEVL